MITSRNTGNDGNKNIRIRDEVIEKVNKFKYLGAYVTSKNEVTEEIKSENKVLRKKYRPKWDEMTGEWRRLHNEKLHGLYDSTDIIKIMKSRRLWCAGHVARMGGKRSLYSILVGRPARRRPLGRLRRRWEDNIRRDLREVGVRDENWLDIAQNRIQWPTFVTAAMHLRVP